MSETTLHRLKAILLSGWYGYDLPEEEASNMAWEKADETIRAVLQALMEPTEEMENAGHNADIIVMSGGPVWNPRSVWQAMLSSILTEKVDNNG